MAKPLGLPERATLVVLATTDGTMLASDLNKTHGIDLKKANRERLVSEGLVESKPEKRSQRLTLTPKGWRFLDDGIAADAQAKVSKASAVALFALLGAFARRGVKLEPLLRGAAPVAPAPEEPAESLEGRIAGAYRKLAREPGDWVRLREIRDALADVTRGELDDTLRRLRREKRLTLTLEDDQGSLTKADRDAALRIGSDDMHYLRIDAR